MSSSPRGVRTSAARRPLALARAVRCDDERVIVTLTDGREVSAPLTPRLRAATPEQRARGRVVDFGTGLRWDQLDEDLGLAPFLGVSEDDLEDFAGFERDPR